MDTLCSSKSKTGVALIHRLHLPSGPSCNAEKRSVPLLELSPKALLQEFSFPVKPYLIKEKDMFSR